MENFEIEYAEVLYKLKKYDLLFQYVLQFSEPDALYYQAECFNNGFGVEKDIHKAYDLYITLAEMGVAKAQVSLGIFYEEGTFISENKKQAFDLYQKAAQQKFAPALYRLGVCFDKGIGTEVDENKAIQLFKEASELGYREADDELYKICKVIGKEEIKEFAIYRGEKNWYANAMYRIGGLIQIDEQDTDVFIIEDGKTQQRKCLQGDVCFVEIDGKKMNAENSFYYFMEAATAGNAEAQFQVAEYYRLGKIVEQNIVKATKYYKLSAKQNNSDAQFLLALCYENGFGLKKNKDKAFVLYKKVANSDSIYKSDAIYHLGLCYEYGIGTDRDSIKAFNLYEQISEYHTEAMFRLGLLYEYGKGVKENKKKAVSLYRKVANNGYGDACYQLAFCYLYGEGVDESEHKANEYFKKAVVAFREASKFDDAYALCNLGVCYENGFGVKKDTSKAFELYKSSSDLGYETAICYLAECYLEGIGVEQNEQVAIKLYTELSDGGNPIAQFHLGLCYEENRGVENSMVAAELLYQKAAEQDYKPAIEHLKHLKDMELKEAQSKVKEQQSIIEHLRQTQFSNSEVAQELLEGMRTTIQNTEDIKTDTKTIIGLVEKMLEESSNIQQYLRADLQEIISLERKELALAMEENRKDIESILADYVERVSKDISGEIMESTTIFAEYEKKMKQLFGSSWDSRKMTTSARNALVSANIMWDSININDDRFDYSGICILSTAALESVVKQIFFFDYKKYVQNTRKENVASLLTTPDSLVFYKPDAYSTAVKEYDKPSHGNTKKYKCTYKEGKFVTLGNLPFIFGSKVDDISETYKETAFVKYKRRMSQEVLSEYLKSIVKDEYKENPIQAFQGFVADCELIRENYRNKAAHTRNIQFTEAAKCYAAVIGVDRKIKAYEHMCNINSVLLKLFNILK